MILGEDGRPGCTEIAAVGPNSPEKGLRSGGLLIAALAGSIILSCTEMEAGEQMASRVS
jgi:hypothetical protein